MRLRLILSFIIIVIVAIASVTVVARRQTESAVNAFMHRGGLSGTEGLVNSLETYYQTKGSWEGVETIFRRKGQGLGQGQNREAGFPDQRLKLADVNGNILIDTQDETPEKRLSLSERKRAINLEVDKSLVGYLLPELNSPISQIATQALVSRINQAAFTAAILASAVAIALALYLSYRLLRPVEELTQAAQNLADGDLSHRVPVRGGDELAILANTFNLMASSLELAETRRQALTADIAHELRTPLAVQRAQIEALEDGIYDLTIESLKPIEEHNYLLTRLVDDLRMLALADSGQLDLLRTPTDFNALIKNVVTRLEPQAADRDILIQYDSTKSVPMLVLDGQRIEQILNNLLDNALRYTPDEGVIHVQLSINGDYCVLKVQDDGPGIPPEDLTRIFERFYRSDKARSREDGGTGLGLSIARKIAQAHGGDLTADNQAGGGAVLTLLLPVEEI